MPTEIYDLHERLVWWSHREEKNFDEGVLRSSSLEPVHRFVFKKLNVFKCTCLFNQEKNMALSALQHKLWCLLFLYTIEDGSSSIHHSSLRQQTNPKLSSTKNRDCTYIYIHIIILYACYKSKVILVFLLGKYPQGNLPMFTWLASKLSEIVPWAPT